MKPKSLTKIQAAFVREYLIDLNAAQAALRAGYAESTAYSQASLWVSDSRDGCPEKYQHVWDAVQIALEERAKRAEIDADFILNGLRDVFERSMQAVPVLDRKGNETGEYRFYPQAANRALELMGKHVGMFREKVEIHDERDGLKQLLEEVDGSTKGLLDD